MKDSQLVGGDVEQQKLKVRARRGIWKVGRGEGEAAITESAQSVTVAPVYIATAIHCPLLHCQPPSVPGHPSQSQHLPLNVEDSAMVKTM